MNKIDESVHHEVTETHRNSWIYVFSGSSFLCASVTLW
jgi:hypothetical protein